MSDNPQKRHEAMSYLLGLALALVLTLPIFAMVAWDLASRGTILWVTAGAAVIQMAVRLRFFLHIRLKGQTREDLHLILFTTLILALMGFGTIWLLWDLHARMG